VTSGEREWAKLDVLHRESLEELLPSFHLERLTSSEQERLVFAWHRLDPWPDAAAGLELLRRSYVVATLSNGNVSLLVDLIRHAGLRFDAVLSAEVARSYKPAPAVYSMALDLLDLRPEQALMVAAHADDLEAAAAVGMRTAFVSRPAEWGGRQHFQPPPRGHFDIQAADFADLARQLGVSVARASAGGADPPRFAGTLGRLRRVELF